MRAPVLVALVLAVLALVPARADDAPQPQVVIPTEGRLLDANDAPVNGVLQMRFAIYPQASESPGQAPTPLWSATYTVDVTQGIYAVTLGDLTDQSATVLGTDVFADGKPRWLGIQIGAMELVPRLLVGTMPQAAVASRAIDSDALSGQTLADLDGRYALLNPTTPQPGSLSIAGSVTATGLSVSGTVEASGVKVSGGIAANGLSIAGDVTAGGTLTGSGAGLSSLPAASLVGSISDANLPSDVPRLGASANPFTGALSASSVTANGNVTAQGEFIGDGAGLTNVPVASLAVTGATNGDLLTFTGSGWTPAAPPKGISFPAPTLATIDPPTLHDTSGTTVTLTGTNFLPGATVTFGAGSPVAASVTDFSHLSVTTPVTSCNDTLPVTVTNVDGQSSAPMNVSCAYPSCRAILQSNPSAGDGVYPIGLADGSTVQLFCDMTFDGGGWTLVAQGCDPNAAATGSIHTAPLTNPGGNWKLSDANIDALRQAGTYLILIRGTTGANANTTRLFQTTTPWTTATTMSGMQEWNGSSFVPWGSCPGQDFGPSACAGSGWYFNGNGLTNVVGAQSDFRWYYSGGMTNRCLLRTADGGDDAANGPGAHSTFVR